MTKLWDAMWTTANRALNKFPHEKLHNCVKDGKLQIFGSLDLCNISSDQFLHVYQFENHSRIHPATISTVGKGKKWPRGKSRVCPKCFCSLFFFNLNKLLFCLDYVFSHNIRKIKGQKPCGAWKDAPSLALRNCNKSLDILNFYLLLSGCRT